MYGFQSHRHGLRIARNPPITLLKKRMSTESQDLTLIEKLQHFLQTFYGNQGHGILSIEKKCIKFCQMYRTLPISEKNTFLCYLAQHYGVNQGHIVAVAQQVVASQDRGEAALLKVEERMRGVLAARYQLLFSHVGRIQDGVKFLVDMRADILAILQSSCTEMDKAYLQALQSALREVLALWFTVGFLHLERITWESPCDMVQKISDYEAVHPIRNWADLKRRVGSYRRCFVFTHMSMPREPVVVLHTALTSQISSSIHSIIGHPRFSGPLSPQDQAGIVPDGEEEDPNVITTAMFYSITSTQRGLQGVDLGNYLIKKVVNELQQEFPSMDQFSSLSPVPGFRDWLIGEINKHLHRHKIGETVEGDDLLSEAELESIASLSNSSSELPLETLKDLTSNHSWIQKEYVMNTLKEPLMRLCAKYLYVEKRRGYALNPVANFHLQNGAVLWRLNWCADMTMRGLAKSCGIMVNYRYFLDNTESNSQLYIDNKVIQTSSQILDLCQPYLNKSDSK